SKATSDKPPFVWPVRAGRAIRDGMRRSWILLGALVLPVGLALVLVPSARRAVDDERGQPPIAKLSKGAAKAAAAATAPPPPSLAGLDPTKMKASEAGFVAPLERKKVARLAVDPELQRITSRVLAMHHVPEASVVLMDAETGKVLV